MDFGLEWHQQELQRVAREMLSAACSTEGLRAAEESELGFSRDLYREMGELGWLQLGLPASAGGAEDFADLVVLYEEFGRAALPGPHFSSGVLAAGLIGGFGSAQQQALLADLGSGQKIATLALYEEEPSDDPFAIRMEAQPVGDRVRLRGRKLFVPFASAADVLLVEARTGQMPGEITLLLVPSNAPGLRIGPLLSMSNDRLHEVVFDDVSVPKSAVVGEWDGGWAALQMVLPRASVLQAAELVGLADASFEMALDYARQRIAFGRPIGAFQAIQHKCAEMVADRDAARFLVYQAACLINTGHEQAPEVAMAKGFAAAAARRVTKEAHQIFAGAGFILEHRLNYYYRRAKAIELTLGDVDLQLERVADRLGI